MSKVESMPAGALNSVYHCCNQIERSVRNRTEKLNVEEMRVGVWKTLVDFAAPL